MPNQLRLPTIAMLAGLPPKRLRGQQRDNSASDEQFPEEIGDKRDSGELPQTNSSTEATTMESTQASVTETGRNSNKTKEGSWATSFSPGIGRFPMSLERRIQAIENSSLSTKHKEEIVSDVVKRYYLATSSGQQAVEVLFIGAAVVAVIALGTLAISFASRIIAPSMPEAMGSNFDQ